MAQPGYGTCLPRIPHPRWAMDQPNGELEAENWFELERWAEQFLANCMGSFNGFNDGTEGSPGAYWSNDTNTGFFRYGNDSISLSLGGDERIRFASNGQILAADVTSANRPVYSFLEDNTSGFQTLSPGGLIQVVVSGDVCWEFDGDDFLCHPSNVGQIYADNGSASAPGYTFNSDANGNSGFWQPAENVIGVTCAGAEVARFTSSGLVMASGKTITYNGTINTYTQTYSTATRTFSAYTADDESVAYTGIDNAQAGTVYAQLTDLNALRAAYETLRAHAENTGKLVNALIDDLQTAGMLG